jgi:hypothetical protein
MKDTYFIINEDNCKFVESIFVNVHNIKKTTGTWNEWICTTWDKHGTFNNLILIYSFLLMQFGCM